MTAYHRPASTITVRDDPEDGAAARRVVHWLTEEGTCALLGFASEAGVIRNKGRAGAQQAPAAIRTALYGLPTPELFSPLSDLGDVVVEGDDLEQGQALLAQHISDALKNHRHLLVLGGGHETAYGSYQGVRRAFPDKKIGIINLDAHLDIRAVGPRGGSSGTPFYQIKQAEGSDFDYLCIGVAAEANTAALFERAKKWGVRIISDHALAQDMDSAQAEITAITKRCDLIYLTIDMDVLPHYQAPGVSAPAARGVALSVIETVIAQVRQACRTNECLLPLADIVEVSPPHDCQNMTARTAAYLALSLLCEDTY